MVVDSALGSIVECRATGCIQATYQQNTHPDRKDSFVAGSRRDSAKEKPLATSRTSGRLRDTAYERLKDAVRHQELEPGQALSETYLSKTLGISRTPVREAIHQLVQEGLLQVIPGRAVTVAAPSAQAILNVIHIRSLLEPEVARLVAASPSPETVSALRETLARMQAAAAQGDRAAWSRADTQWHELLANACPNQLLGELTLQMRNRTHGLSVGAQTTSVRILDCTTEHQRVVDGIASQMPQEAEQAMRIHIRELRESMIRRLMSS
jgi:DNA-binding GntR family transcriptional regulator